MNFNAPHTMLNLFWLLPMIVLICYFGYRIRRKRISDFIATWDLANHLTANASIVKRRCRDMLFVLGILFIVVAISGPYWGTKLVKRPSHSRDLLVVLDSSRSMLATDISPSRLKHAKWFIRQLMEQTPGDRYGLIAFSGTAFLECPLTQDRNGLLLFLDDIDTDTIPTGGTNVEEALRTALEAFKAAEGNHRAIVLITDGDELQGDSSSILKELKERNIPIFAVGIGDPDMGSFIQVEGNRFITDKEGNRVKTKLNEASLRRIAESVGGTYVHSTAVHDGISHIVEKVNALIPEQQEENTVSRPIERYQIPLLLGVLCIVARLVMGERRSPVKINSSVVRNSMPLILGLAIQWNGYNICWQLLFSQLHAEEEQPSFEGSQESRGVDSGVNGPLIIDPQSVNPGDAQGNPGTPSPVPKPLTGLSGLEKEKTALIERSIEALKEQVANATDPLELGYLHYNLGVNYQLLGQLAEAEAQYNKALDARTESNELAAVTYQNLGVLRHQEARKNLAADPDQALQNLLEAQEYYREAMRKNPTLSSVGSNQELVLRERKLVEEMKRIQEQLSNMQENAQQATEEALDAQKTANESQNPAEKEENQNAAFEKTKDAQDAVSQLNEAVKELGEENSAELFEQAVERLEEATNRQEDALKSLSNNDDAADDDSGEKAEELISEALRQLEGEINDEEGSQDDTNLDQKQENHQESLSSDEDQPASGAEDPFDVSKSGSNEEDGGQEGLQDLDKLQALRVLDDLQELEKDLKQELKNMQKKNRRLKEVEKNW